MSSLYAKRTVLTEASGQRRRSTLNAIPSIITLVGKPLYSGSSISLRCFSPTSFWCSTLNSPSNRGSGNACPHGPPARSNSAVCSENSSGFSSPSLRMMPLSAASSSSSRTSWSNNRQKRSKFCSSMVNPAAIA